ncbi:DMT family transporter [Pelagibacterium xiamenense]|uniref:DMT family transporter n=1 Tax=Pelagibacterium xiamenense TaxID=2901140 RepID=UPI001E3F9FCF|nr:DMT family transporter [Pelagibacterium xiamenense]MCD7060253.1 DMT family transporter [Pelagibacterium xiamenense]
MTATTAPAPMSRPVALGCLLLATIVWGLAFIAQKSAMGVMGPLTFLAARYLLGGLLIVPLALREDRRQPQRLTRRQWLLIGFLSFNFFMGSWLQQAGLAHTTVTNGGFLTGLYVFFVPLILLVVFRTPPHKIVWLCAPVALIGLYLLNGARLDGLNPGDGLVIGSAVFWALHVLMLGFLAKETGRPIFVSSASFLIAGLLSLVGAFAIETPTMEALSLGWVEILYAGVFSTAIGFTLQAIGQQHVPPANAAIILSAESLFAALGGAVVLGERLLPLGYLGAGCIFMAIVLVEVIPTLRKRPAASIP